MKNITVSTDVFAAIWSNHEIGENSEDAILRRLLGCDEESTADEPQEDFTSNLDEAIGPNNQGFTDSRNGLYFPEGFQVYRYYKGEIFEAMASQGYWVRLDTDQKFASLNQLNRTIAAGEENVWRNWKYEDDRGFERTIDSLRN